MNKGLLFLLFQLTGPSNMMKEKILQEGVCWSEAPLRCTKGPYMAKPCSPVLMQIGRAHV